MNDNAKTHNTDKTCWNCPAVEFQGHVDFRACGQAALRKAAEGQLVVECKRRPEIGLYDPMGITYGMCTEYRDTDYGRMLDGMKVMIPGIDGYLGWALALKLASLGCKVSGIDNFLRRKLVEEKQAMSVVPIGTREERIKAAKKHLGVDIDFREMDILDRERFFPFIEEIRPESIVQYAEIPSAPYSMVNVEKAIETINNNVIGTLGLCFALRDYAPEASIIKLGTMGEYGSPLTGRPIFEGLFPGDATLEYEDDEWSLGGELTPRDPVSFYHVSKVQGTFTVYEACKYWWLRSYDVMQGVVYGIYTPEMDIDPSLSTRFDIDEWWGTVINRFVAQTVIGMPMTIFGSGNQMRGYITIADAIQCVVRMIVNPPEPGQYDVVNQLTEVLSVRRIAETVARIGKKEFGLDAMVQRLENPRVEAEEHPYEIIHDKLRERFGFTSEQKFEDEVYYMFKRLTEPKVRKNIEMIKDSLIPRTRWSGEQKELRVLETYKP